MRPIATDVCLRVANLEGSENVECTDHRYLGQGLRPRVHGGLSLGPVSYARSGLEPLVFDWSLGMIGLPLENFR